MNLIQMASQFYDARDTCRRIYGKDWTSHRLSFGSIIRHYAKHNTNGNTVAATIRLMSEAENNPNAAGIQLMLMGACAELEVDDNAQKAMDIGSAGGMF